MHKFLIYSFVLTTLCSCSSSPSKFPASEAPKKVVPEEYAVYDAIINDLYIKEDVKIIVLREQTIDFLHSGDDLEVPMKYVKNKFPKLANDTLNDFLTRNGHTHILENEFKLRVPCVLISEEQYREVWNTVDGRFGWTEFYNKHPGAQGIAALSRVGFNNKKDQALVYLGNSPSTMGGQSYYVLLEKQGGNWKVQERYLWSVS